MTERWRKRLGDLDKVGPDEQVFHRAAAGPQLPNESIPLPSRGSRVVGGVAAFVVFALAISVFVIPALRMDQTAGAPGEALLPLWPARTLDEAERFQQNADDAGEWYELVDPSRTASRFATDVMGWSPDRLRVSERAGSDQPGLATSYPSGNATAVAYYGVPSGYPTGYSTGYPSTGSLSPFRTFVLSPTCGPTERCVYVAETEVTVFQPIREGDGGVWMVLEARSDGSTLSVGEGMTLTDGDEIAAGFGIPEGAHVNFGYHVGSGACGVTVTTDTFRSPADPSRFILVSGGSGLTVTLDDVRSDPDCVSPQPGYIFSSMAYEPYAGDVLTDTGKGLMISVSAVPVAFAWDEAAPPSNVEPTFTSPAPAPAAWKTWIDTLGWTIDVPAGWQEAEIATQGRVSTVGGAFAPKDTPIPDGEPTAPSEPGQIIVYVLHREGGSYEPPADDSSFPLSCDLLIQPGADQGTVFRGDGLPFEFSYAVGDDRPTAQQREIACHMLESIRFQPWAEGDVRNGLMATIPRDVLIPKIQFAQPTEGVLDGTWVTDAGLPYFVALPIDHCEAAGRGESSWETDGQVLTISCADGTSARFARDGTPAEGNPQEWTDPLPSGEAIVSWNGWVLTPVKG